MKWNPELLTATKIDKEHVARSVEGQAAKGGGKGAALKSALEGACTYPQSWFWVPQRAQVHEL